MHLPKGLQFLVKFSKCCHVQDLSFPVWVLGIASAGALGVTAILAILYLCITIFGSAGRHIRIVAIPVG